MKLKIFVVDKNEARSVEAEAGVNGSVEPIVSVNNAGNTERQHKKDDGSDEEKPRHHRVGRSDRAEEEKVDSNGDGKEIQNEKNERVSLNGIGGERKRVQRRLMEDREESGNGSEKRDESVEKEVNGRRRGINGVAGERVESCTDAIEANSER